MNDNFVLAEDADSRELQSLKIVVTAWGKQPNSVGSHSGSERTRYVLVVVGQVMMYVHDRPALESIADAWADAVVTADKMRLVRKPVPETWRGIETAITAAAHVTGNQRHQVLGVGAGASPNGYAHVALTVGSVTFRLYDRGAIESFAEAWALALDTSAVFGMAGPSFRELRAARGRALP